MDIVLPQAVNRLSVRSLVLSLILVVSTLVGCSSNVTQTGEDAVSTYNANPLTVAIPANFPADKLEEALVNALNGREWNVLSSTDTEAIGHLVHRGFDATVTLISDGEQVKILNDSTFIHKNDEGQPRKPAVPMGWLVNLQNDLTQILASQ